MSERTPQSQSVGVSISGTVGTARDIVGRDKITIKVGSVPEEVAGEVIRQTDERRKATADMSGMWADASGSIFQITQTGDTFSYSSLNRQTGLRSQGTGSINGHQFNTTFMTNVPSTGTATGKVSDDGLEVIETVQDSVFGSYSLRARRQ